MPSNDPHRFAEVFRTGAEVRGASSVMLLLHGKGATAADILGVGREIAPPEMALVAPQASGNTWYPNSFLAQTSQNEPWLSSALNMIESLLQRCFSEGIPTEGVIIGGFSQGACLATEFVARHPRPYAALLAFTGGLFGPHGSDLQHPGSLHGVSALFSSGDPDPHIPWTRVEESAHELRRMGAQVQIERYPGRPHKILPQELSAARILIKRVLNR